MWKSLQGLEQLVVGVPLVWLFVVLVMLLLRKQVHAWAERRTSSALKGDSRAAAVLGRIYVPGLTLIGLYSSLELAGDVLPHRWLGVAEKSLLALAWFIITVLVWRSFSMLVSYWARTNPNASTLVPPIQLLGRIVIVLFAGTLVYGALKGEAPELSKVWTAFGIGSVAIALALQETLTNTIAGFYLMLDQPIRIGDYIKVESGEEGRVLQIGWRSTRLVSLSNNVVVIPNSKLARASITNYTMPQPRLAISVSVKVGYDSDPRRVAGVLEQVAHAAALDLDGLLPDPPPSVRLIPGFGDSSLDFSVNCQVRDFTAQYAVQDELRHRIFERLRQEGIAMALPTRELHVKAENQSAGT